MSWRSGLGWGPVEKRWSSHGAVAAAEGGSFLSQDMPKSSRDCEKIGAKSTCPDDDWIWSGDAATNGHGAASFYLCAERLIGFDRQSAGLRRGLARRIPGQRGRRPRGMERVARRLGHSVAFTQSPHRPLWRPWLAPSL